MNTPRLAALVLLAAPVTVTAQFGSLQFGVAAGATFPNGDLSRSGYGMGWQGMTFVAFRIRHSPVAFRLDGNYGANTSSEPINGVPTERRVKLLGGDADVTLTFPGPARHKFYLLVGPGLYRASDTDTQFGVTSSAAEPTKFAYNLGAGFTIGALFLEARYVHVDGFGHSFSRILNTITAGLRLGGW
jgi:hypothetical protein